MTFSHPSILLSGKHAFHFLPVTSVFINNAIHQCFYFISKRQAKIFLDNCDIKIETQIIITFKMLYNVGNLLRNVQVKNFENGSREMMHFYVRQQNASHILAAAWASVCVCVFVCHTLQLYQKDAS